MRSRKTSYFKTTSLPSIYFQSNMIFRDYRTIKTVFFFIFLDSYDCFAMIKRNVTIVNMVKKWNNGMSYSTCFCDIFWGDFIWSITGKSSFQRLWLCVDFFFALIAISNKFDFCVFFFSFFFRNRELKKMFIPFDFLQGMKEKCWSIVWKRKKPFRKNAHVWKLSTLPILLDFPF